MEEIQKKHESSQGFFSVQLGCTSLKDQLQKSKQNH